MKKGLVWFRNDLRLHDNEALSMAHQECDELILLYCFDPRQFGKTKFGFQKTGTHRYRFLSESLVDLTKSVNAKGGELIIRIGKPEELIPEIVKAHEIDFVYYHEEVTDEEVKVELALERSLGDEVLQAFWGSTLYNYDDLPFGIDNLPSVFTAFRKKVEKYAEIRPEFEIPKQLKTLSGVQSEEIPSPDYYEIESAKFDHRSVLDFKGGESAALDRQDHYFWKSDRLKTYKNTRNGLLGADYSSKFSPWLANGTISPRRIYFEVKKYESERKKNDSTDWLIFELIWRDYFRFSAAHFGNLIFQAGGIQKSNRIWSENREVFEAWASGNTGIPFVDANMRELNATGFMSNRGRQNVASFLAQNLNIDWRMGAEYFEQQLLDYDPCSNYGNWAYNATIGHDPRNRYFNIEFQASRYDSKGTFVKTWIPELQYLPIDSLHQPYQLTDSKLNDFGIRPEIYPKPIIDLERSYETIKARG